jgi:hypothetical protein
MGPTPLRRRKEKGHAWGDNRRKSLAREEEGGGKQREGAKGAPEGWRL